MILSVQRLATLLRKRSDDSDVTALVGDDQAAIEQFEHLGYVRLESQGISVMFSEAPYVLPPGQITNARALYVNCFHLHREGHEEYSQYPEDLPGGVTFGDRQQEIVTKLGDPVATGGGGISSIVGSPIPRWIRYTFGDAILQFQLDAGGRMEMASLYVADPRH